MLGMLITGTCNSLFIKANDNVTAAGIPFTHPYIQTAIMFLGELCCFPMYGIKLLLERRKAAKAKEDGEDLLLSPGAAQAQKKELPTNINPLWLAIPATCDFCGSSLMMISLTMVPVSIYQMMRGIIVAITALFSVVFLKRRLHRHHWTGVALIVLGVVQVGVVAILDTKNHPDPDSTETTNNMASGIVLLLLSQCFAATQFIVEEKILGGYYLDPFRAVGTEGMWGLCYYMALLPAM